MLASTFDLDTSMAQQRRQAQLTKPFHKPLPRCKTGSCSGGPRQTSGPSRTRIPAWTPLRALHHAQPCQPPRQQQRCWSPRPRPLQCCLNPPFFLSKPLLLCQCVSPRDRRRYQHGLTFFWGLNGVFNWRRNATRSGPFLLLRSKWISCASTDLVSAQSVNARAKLR